MKTIMLVVVLLVLGGLTGSAIAGTTYIFRPTPIDLKDLPHQYYYTWGINKDINGTPFVLPATETIIGATLTFYNIYDWTTETNDRLYIHLLDNPAAGVRPINDNQNGGDNFAGTVGTWTDEVLVHNIDYPTEAWSWTDTHGGHPSDPPFKLVYDFSILPGSVSGTMLLDDLNSYAGTAYGTGKANFGFGIDPDCHYYNDGVEFVITTKSVPTVPTPGAIFLGGIGTCLVGWLRTRKTL